MKPGKYYISFGKTRTIIYHGNSVAACINVFRRYFNKDDPPRTLPTVFRVSQLGFDEHENDEYYSVGEIIKIIQLSNQARKSLKEKR